VQTLLVGGRFPNKVSARGLFCKKGWRQWNGVQRLMSHPCSMASSCVHAVTSYL